jgi:hypothetical protein
MRYPALLAISMLGALFTFPAFGSPCGDEIQALEARVDAAAADTAALSSGGQGVAASREAQAMQAERGQTQPGTPVQKLPEHDVGATAAATPLAGGDKALKARAALNRARALDQQGNAAGCSEAVAEVKRELGPTQ